MKKLLLIVALLILFAGCDPKDEDSENTYLLPQTEPAMVIYNDSKLDINISYIMDDDPDSYVDAKIPAGTEYEIEDGVKDITITGCSF